MSLKKFVTRAITLTSIFTVTVAAVSQPAKADTLVDSSNPFIDVTLSTAGAQTADYSNLLNYTVANFDNFNSGFYTASCPAQSGKVACYSTPNGLVTNVGTFDQAFIQKANQYGGAGGTGNYFDVDQLTAGYSQDIQSTLTLNSPQQYLGFWWSAGDPYNVVKFYNGDSLVGTYQTSNVVNYISSINGQGYYGNPSDNFKGQDGGEPFAFLNFYAKGNTQFTKLVFTNNSGTGFEVDNITLAQGYQSNKVTQVPEPSNIVSVLALATLGLLSQRKRIFG